MKTRFWPAGRRSNVTSPSTNSVASVLTRGVMALGLGLATIPVLSSLLRAVELAALTVPQSPYVEGELLVKFTDGPFSVQADQCNAAAGAHLRFLQDGRASEKGRD